MGPGSLGRLSRLGGHGVEVRPGALDLLAVLLSALVVLPLAAQFRSLYIPGTKPHVPRLAWPQFGIHLTGGSNSIKNSYTQYRELGARARAMLVQAAATRWGVDAASLRTQNGAVLGAGGRRLGYGELAEAAMALPVPASVTLKDPKQFRLIGQPTTRLDAAAKSSGRQDFGIDVRRPGQLTAVVARPPVFGAKLKSVDDTAARAVKVTARVREVAGPMPVVFSILRRFSSRRASLPMIESMASVIVAMRLSRAAM